MKFGAMSLEIARNPGYYLRQTKWLRGCPTYNAASSIVSINLITIYQENPDICWPKFSVFVLLAVYWIGFVLHLAYTGAKQVSRVPTDKSPHNDDVKNVSILLESELIGPV